MQAHPHDGATRHKLAAANAGVISPNRDATKTPAAGGFAAASVVRSPCRNVDALEPQARTDHHAYRSASAALATTTAR